MTIDTLGAAILEKSFLEINKAMGSRNYSVLETQQISLREQIKAMLKNNDHELCAQYLFNLSMLLNTFDSKFLDGYAVLLNHDKKTIRKIFAMLLQQNDIAAILWLDLYKQDLHEYAEEYEVSDVDLRSFIEATKANLQKLEISVDLPSLENIYGFISMALTPGAEINKAQWLYNASICGMHLVEKIFRADYKGYADLYSMLIKSIEMQTVNPEDIDVLKNLFGFNSEAINMLLNIKIKPDLLKTGAVFMGLSLAEELMRKTLMSKEQLEAARLTIDTELKAKIDFAQVAVEQIFEYTNSSVLEVILKARSSYIIQDSKHCFACLQTVLEHSASINKLIINALFESENKKIIKLAFNEHNPDWLRMLAALELIADDTGDKSPDDQRALLTSKQKTFKSSMFDKITGYYSVNVNDPELLRSLSSQQFALVQNLRLETAFNMSDAQQFINIVLEINTVLEAALIANNFDAAADLCFNLIDKPSLASRLLFVAKTNYEVADKSALTQQYLNIFVAYYYKMSLEAGNYGYHNSHVRIKATYKHQAEIEQFVVDLYAAAGLKDKYKVISMQDLASFGEAVSHWDQENNNPRKILQNLTSFEQISAYSSHLYYKIKNLDLKQENIKEYADLIFECLSVFEMAQRRSKPEIIHAICSLLVWGYAYNEVEFKLMHKILQASKNNDEAELFVCLERLLSRHIDVKIDVKTYLSFKAGVYHYLSYSYGLTFDEIIKKSESPDMLDKMLAISLIAEQPDVNNKADKLNLAVKSLAKDVIAYFSQQPVDQKIRTLAIDDLEELKSLSAYIKTKNDRLDNPDELMSFTLWTLLRNCSMVDRLIPFDITQIFKDYAKLIPELETTLNGSSAQDFYIMGKKIKMALFEAFDRLDSVAMAKASLAVVTKLSQQISLSKNYASRNLAITLLTGFELGKQTTNDLLALLEADKLPQAALYLVQHYDFRLKQPYIASDKRFEPGQLGAWIVAVSTELGLANHTPCYGSRGYELAIWKIHMIIAQLTEDSESFAKWLKPQASFIKQVVNQGIESLVSSEYKLTIKYIKRLTRSALANSTDDLHMDLAEIIFDRNKKYSFNFRIAKQINHKDLVTFKSKLYQELGIDLTRLSLPAMEKFSIEKAKIYINYIYEKANAGEASVDFTHYEDYVPSLARLNNITTDLPALKDTDSQQYKTLFMAVHRIWWDHLVAHRFGIGGKSEIAGMVYTYDGSLMHTMVEQLKSSFANFVLSPDFISTADYAKDRIDTHLADNPVSDEIWVQTGDYIIAEVAAIANSSMSQPECADKYAKDKIISLPVYTEGHLSGVVIFNHHQQDYCLMSNRGAIESVENLESLGINIYAISKPGNIALYAERITAAIGGDSLSKENLQALNDSLGLKQCYFVAKKMQKSGNCGFSSCAKLIGQSIAIAAMYRLTCDFAIAVEAAQILYKGFTAFDRENILRQYMSNAQEFGFEPNQELLARVNLTCEHKAAYKPALLFLQHNSAVRTTPALVDTVKQKHREEIEELILALAALENTNKVDLCELRELATEYAELNYRHANADQMRSKFIEIITALRGKYGHNPNPNKLVVF